MMKNENDVWRKMLIEKRTVDLGLSVPGQMGKNRGGWVKEEERKVNQVQQATGECAGVWSFKDDEEGWRKKGCTCSVCVCVCDGTATQSSNDRANANQSDG